MFVFCFLFTAILPGVYETQISKKNHIFKLFLRFTEMPNLHLLYINYLKYMVEGRQIASALIQAG